MLKLLIAESTGFSPVALARLRQVAQVAERDLSRQQLLAALPDVDVLWVRLRNRIDEEMLSAAPRLKWLALAYFLFIWIASVQLGWHYVLDGAAGALGVLAIWTFAGPIERRITHGRAALSGDTKARLASTENSRSRE